MKTLPELIDSFRTRHAHAITDRKNFRTFHYTYAQLHDTILRVHALYLSRGVRSGDRIMFWAQNSFEYTACLLACMSMGCVAVPIDTRHTHEFFMRVHAHCTPSLVIHSRSRAVGTPNTLVIDELHWRIRDHEPEPLQKIPQHTLAELLYNSSSPSTPKGVMLTHANLMSNVNAALNIQHVTTHSRFLSLLPLSHVFEQIVGLLIPLHQGARITYITTLKPSNIFDALREERITHCTVVPRLLELFEQHIRAHLTAAQLERALRAHGLRFHLIRHRIRKQFGHLRNFVCGGAALDHTLELFFERIGIPVIQVYGLTEGSGIVSANTEHAKETAGKPLPGLTVRIAPDGEILIKGTAITSGYYKNPQATKQALQGGWLHTGDIGTLDAQGRLTIKGRKKDVILTAGGIKVYPSDIEAVLRAQKGVRDAEVIGIKHGRTERVHAVLLLAKNVQAADIIQIANAKLDSAQHIKSHTLCTDGDFPRTAHKKESAVRRHLRELTTEPILPHKTLRDLGLSSIDRVDLLTRLEQSYGTDFDDDILDSQITVKQIETYVNKRKQADQRQIVRPWSRLLPLRMLRTFVQDFILLPIASFFGEPSVRGLEHLEQLKGPAFFVANHQSHFDVPIMLLALPFHIRRRLAVAMWQEFFFTNDRTFHSAVTRLSYYLSLTFWNGFAFSQRKWFRRSAQYAGELMDDGWNILLFPEGKRTTTHDIGTFRGGIGLFAQEMRTPIVPLRIEKVNVLLPIGGYFPRFTRTIVVIGEPLMFTNETPLVATHRIEATIRSLL